MVNQWIGCCVGLASKISMAVCWFGLWGVGEEGGKEEVLGKNLIKENLAEKWGREKKIFPISIII